MKNTFRLFSFSLILFIKMIILVLSFIKLKKLLLLVTLFFILFIIPLFFLIIFFKKYRYLFNLFLLFLISFLFLFRINNIYKNYLYSNEIILNNRYCIAKIISHPTKYKNKIELIAKIIAIKNEEITDYFVLKNKFNIIIKIENNNLDLFKGDILKIEKRIKLPPEKIFNYSYKNSLFQKGIYGIVEIKKGEIKKINLPLNPLTYYILKFLNTLSMFREKILKKLRESLSKDSFTFIISILFGERKELDIKIIEQFSNTGMIHLLAISGLHISFIAGLISSFFSLVVSRSKSCIISLIFLTLYILLLSPSASSYRAFWMYFLHTIFFVLGIKASTISIFSLSGIILLFINPFYVFDLGFKFSFLATAGILLISNHIKEKLPHGIPEKLNSLISITFSAFLFIFPFQWCIFKKIPIFSLLSSLLVVPLFSVLFGLFFVLLIISLALNINYIYNIINFLVSVFLKLITLLDNIKSIKLPSFPEYFAVFFIALIILYFYFLDNYLKKVLVLLKNKLFLPFVKKYF